MAKKRAAVAASKAAPKARGAKGPGVLNGKVATPPAAARPADDEGPEELNADGVNVASAEHILATHPMHRFTRGEYFSTDSYIRPVDGPERGRLPGMTDKP